MNRPVRTRMPGGVGRAGETPVLTRLGAMVDVEHLAVTGAKRMR